MSNDLKFGTLIKENQEKVRWYPTSVDRYAYSITLDASIPNSAVLRRNIAYNLQYVEYLEKQLAELKLSDVIYTMTCKSYVITGMSILEGLFSNLLKSKGLWKKTKLVYCVI